MRIIFVLLLCFISSEFCAQHHNYLGAKSVAMGNMSSVVQNSWSVWQNPSALALMSHSEVSFFDENRFGCKELSTHALCVTKLYKSSAWGLGWIYQGFSLYSNRSLAFAYSKKMSPHFFVGIGFHFFNTRLGLDYGTHTDLLADLGFTAQVSPDFIIAGSIRNITHTRQSLYQNERIPSVINVGLGWNFGKHMFWGFECEMRSNFKPYLKSGLEYQILDLFFLRCGLQSDPLLFNFGFGVKIKMIRVDLASSYHPVLGYSPAISLNYVF